MAHNPISQFDIEPLIPIKIGNIDISFTNSSLFMIIAVTLIGFFFLMALRNTRLVPGKLQNMAELSYIIVGNIIKENASEKGMKFMPIIFSLFMFVLICNLLGMVPYAFTVTSHISVTFLLAAFIFIFCTLLGFVRHGFKFLHLFLPSGVPLWLAPLMIVIEFFTYISRPITLSIRLAGNMVAGHVLLKVLAYFVVALGIYLGWLPFPLMVLLSGFEIFVAILQAYIFAILSCVYLNDALNLH